MTTILSKLCGDIRSLLTFRDTEVCRLYEEEDQTLMQIADASGLNRTTIARILRKHGVELYSRGAPSHS